MSAAAESAWNALRPRIINAFGS